MSESNKFTPGPWEVVEDIRYEDKESQYTAGFDIFNFDGTSVVGCEGISGDSEKERANAILIAAAPDLLEALEKALDALAHCRADIGYSSMQTRAAHMADKAIKKARNHQ